MHSVRRLAESFPLYERCFDASELEHVGVGHRVDGVGHRVDHERLAARLAAKAAAVELIAAVVPWPAAQGSLSAGSNLEVPSVTACSLMRAVTVRGPGAPGLDLQALCSMVRGAQAYGATDAVLVSLTHDAGLAAALVVAVA